MVSVEVSFLSNLATRKFLKEIKRSQSESYINFVCFYNSNEGRDSNEGRRLVLGFSLAKPGDRHWGTEHMGVRKQIHYSPHSGVGALLK